MKIRVLHTVTAAGAFALRPHSQAGLGYVATGPGHRSQTHEAFWPVGHSRPKQPQGRSLGPESPFTVHAFFSISKKLIFV
jgi:hypothetical protein